MNTKKNLLIRLLKLFPIKSVKEHFGIKTSKRDFVIDEVIEKYSEDNILKFACEKFDYSKQHIYIYSHNLKKLSDFGASIFPDLECYQFLNEPKIKSYFYFYETTYSVLILNDQIQRAEVNFKVPLKVVVDDKYIILYFTIVEKNISTYIENSNRVLNFGKSTDEKILSVKLYNEVSSLCSLNLLDLNKGIKYLWESNFIDAPYVKWKRSKSTSTETMDEEYTLKEQYPDIYNQIMNAPIKKTIFKFLIKSEISYNHFIVDPTEGKISFTTFAENIKDKEYVIGKILQHN